MEVRQLTRAAGVAAPCAAAAVAGAAAVATSLLLPLPLPLPPPPPLPLQCTRLVGVVTLAAGATSADLEVRHVGGGISTVLRTSCGIRDVELEYKEIYFDPCDNGCATTVSTAAGLPANSKKRPVQLWALPDWLRVSASRITELQSNVCSVYVEHDDALGAFIETQLSALDMRHITRLCGDTCQCAKCYVHLIEEAVDTARPRRNAGECRRVCCGPNLYSYIPSWS
eukprot:COSAG01_NODE_16805_length_1202_cov_7.427017_1_plen_226_part_00